MEHPDIDPALIGAAGTDWFKLLTAKESAAELGISLPAFWLGVRKERLPMPVYPMARAPRWILGELRTALLKTRSLPREQLAARRAEKIAAT